MSTSDEDGAAPQDEAPPKASDHAVPQELNEDEINAPSKQTLVMLGVISVATLVMWAGGRAACNYQIPGESLTPRPLSLEERTLGSKDVGLEIAQLVSGAKFDLAKTLAVDAGVDWVNTQESSCGACTAQVAARENIFSTATVIKSNSLDAIVKVRTVGAPGGEVIRFFGIERMGEEWKLSRVYKNVESAILKDRPSNKTLPGAVHRVRPRAPEKSEVEVDSERAE